MEEVISVIGTLFNEIHRAERSLYIWTKQKNCPLYELIILDDNSTDGSRDMVREYQKQYPGLIKYYYFKHGRQRSCTLLMNYGVKIARGDFIVMQWYDRIPGSFDLLRSLHVEFMKNRQRDRKLFVSADNGHIGAWYSSQPIPEEKVTQLLNSASWRNDPAKLRGISNIRKCDNESACFMMKRNEFTRLGGFDERYIAVNSYVNIDFYSRCKRDGFLIKTIDTPVYHQSHPRTDGDNFQRMIPDETIIRNVNINWGNQIPAEKIEQ